MSLNKNFCLLLGFMGISVLAGCGAVFVNEGSKNASLADGISNPNAGQPKKINVSPEARIISNFEDGSNNMNSKLIGGGSGSWIDYGGDDGKPSAQFVVSGGANGTKMATHIFGTLVDHGNGKYPEFALSGKFKEGGMYDASPFSGIKFYYKCPATDQASKRRFVIGIAQTVPTSDGGTCVDQCFNHFGADLPVAGDWALQSYAFVDLKRESGWGSPVTPPDLTDHLKEFIYLAWKQSANNVNGSYAIDYWVDEIEFY